MNGGEEYCRQCTDSRGRPKLAFPSEAQAQDALVSAKIKAALHHNQRRREKRVYPCPYGGGRYHLSSIDEIELAERQATAARRKAIMPLRAALNRALAGTGLDEHADALAELLHDDGWTAPRPFPKQRTA